MQTPHDKLTVTNDAPSNDLLLKLVRLLARQAAREWRNAPDMPSPAGAPTPQFAGGEHDNEQ